MKKLNIGSTKCSLKTEQQKNYKKESATILSLKIRLFKTTNRWKGHCKNWMFN